MSETPGLFPLPMHTAQLNFPGSFHVVGVLRWVPANGMRQKCQFLASTVHPQHAYTFSKHAFQKRLVWPCDHMLRTAIYHMDKSGSLRDSGTHTAKSHTTHRHSPATCSTLDSVPFQLRNVTSFTDTKYEKVIKENKSNGVALIFHF